MFLLFGVWVFSPSSSCAARTHPVSLNTLKIYSASGLQFICSAASAFERSNTSKIN